tara:strand:- start:11228 stop:11458 length:231 start_codon:yes stop_codon:yes gene_type:complete
MDSSTETTNSQSKPNETPQVKISDIKVDNEQIALNLMIAFLNAAQSRGIYSLEESAKLWECVKFFSKPTEPTDISL